MASMRRGHMQEGKAEGEVAIIMLGFKRREEEKGATWSLKPWSWPWCRYYIEERPWVGHVMVG